MDRTLTIALCAICTGGAVVIQARIVARVMTLIEERRVVIMSGLFYQGR